MRMYPEKLNHLFYDMMLEDSSLFILTSGMHQNFGFGYLLETNPMNGDIVGEYNVTVSGNPDAYRLHMANDYFYLFYYISPASPVDSIQISKFDRLSGQHITSSKIGFPDFILQSAWVFEGDSILLMADVNPEKRIKYLRIASDDLTHDDELQTLPPMGILVQPFPIRQSDHSWLIYTSKGLYHWQEGSDTTARLLKDSLLSYGMIIPSIGDDGYAIFGIGYDATQSIGAQLSIVRLDSNLNFIQRTMFGVGSASYDHPALSSAIDRDAEHYFVSAFIDVSLTPYTSIEPKSFYVGKFDDALNTEWLHIFGGDRNYFISGVKADRKGGCFVYGFSRPEAYNYQSVPFLMRLDADGLLSNTEIIEPGQFLLTILGNPGSDHFRFAFTAAETGYRLRLTDMQGRMVLETPISGGVQELPMAHHHAGTYIWQLFHPNGILLETGQWMKIR
jgi:hypothetical protein